MATSSFCIFHCDASTRRQPWTCNEINNIDSEGEGGKKRGHDEWHERVDFREGEGGDCTEKAGGFAEQKADGQEDAKISFGEEPHDDRFLYVDVRGREYKKSGASCMMNTCPQLGETPRGGPPSGEA